MSVLITLLRCELELTVGLQRIGQVFKNVCLFRPLMNDACQQVYIKKWEKEQVLLF